MLPDFATAYRDFISDDGSVKPPVAVPVPPDHTWAAELDGLMLTMTVGTADGEWCLLSVLFPMAVGAAQAKHRQCRFPVKAGDYLRVIRRHDEVIGHSLETFARFVADVIPAETFANASTS